MSFNLYKLLPCLQAAFVMVLRAGLLLAAFGGLLYSQGSHSGTVGEALGIMMRLLGKKIDDVALASHV